MTDGFPSNPDGGFANCRLDISNCFVMNSQLVNFQSNNHVYIDRAGACLPFQATEYSCCFDISACLMKGDVVRVFDPCNFKKQVEVHHDDITLHPRHRALIPTGLIFSLIEPMFIYPRSGYSVKRGITLVNAVGVIDRDYREELFVPVINHSGVPVQIYHRNRIAQAEFRHFGLVQTSTRPERITNREGGFGSTGGVV